MHKDDVVAEVTFDARGYVDSVPSVLRPELLPCEGEAGSDDLKYGLQRWLLRRTSGRNRADYIPLRSFYGNALFVSKTKASLPDCYWIKEGDEKWEDVSFFRNWDPDEDEYFGIVRDPENTTTLSGNSPNLTLPGNSKRFWYKDNGELGIISEAAQAEMKGYHDAVEIGVDSSFYPRRYIILSGTIYAFHPVDTSEEIERVPFDFFYEKYEQDGADKMATLEKTCEELGIKNWKKFFGNIMKFDEKTGYSDRELSSFGVLRKTDTLEVVGFERM